MDDQKYIDTMEALRAIDAARLGIAAKAAAQMLVAMREYARTIDKPISELTDGEIIEMARTAQRPAA